MRRLGMVDDRIVLCRRRLIPRRSLRGIRHSRLVVGMVRAPRRRVTRLEVGMVGLMRLLGVRLRVRMDDLGDWRVRWTLVDGVRLS